MDIKLNHLRLKTANEIKQNELLKQYIIYDLDDYDSTDSSDGDDEFKASSEMSL
jgi:hypothetical protein